MSLKKQQKEIERQLIEVVNSRANENKCGECGSTYPTWASYNLGLFLCGRCASVHRKILGPTNISKVKSLTLDQWNTDQINSLRKIGNKRVKKKWNPKGVPFPYDDDEGPIEQFIRDKYILGKFRDDNIDPNDYEDRLSRYSDDSDNHLSSNTQSRSYGGSRSRSNSYLNSSRSRSNSAINRPIPKLTHRKLTTFEYTQYTNQAQKILNFGYTNRDSVLESLLLSNGNIDLALDILDQDAKLNPSGEEIPPSLPVRPSISQPSVSQPSVSQPQSQSDEWWTTNNNQTVSSNTTSAGQPQIYQYTDPMTGQISYIDSNGQQYLDPNNPHHQLLLYQQSNPQLIAQQTNKQNILSLYSQPTAFTSNVAAPANQSQPQPQQQTAYQQSQNFEQSHQPQFTGFGQLQQPQQQFQQQQQYNPYQQQGYWG